jgi:hypothetical protein
METAVSWELASKSKSGVPDPIAKLFRDSGHGDPVLLFAIAEHKVDLPGGDAASQCDVWALVQTSGGMLSLSVEAKAKEAFGDEVLEQWLVAGKSEASESIDLRKSNATLTFTKCPSIKVPGVWRLLHYLCCCQ